MATASPNILVVEDDRETRSLIAKYLRGNGCNVAAATDGREMARAMADHRVDLLILDVMLPGEDGLSLCRKVRAELQVPIIMLTVRGEDVDRTSASKSAGMITSPNRSIRVNCWCRRTGVGSSSYSPGSLPRGGPVRGQEILLDPHNINDGKLESLCRVECHQRDAVGRPVDAVDVGHQGRCFQKSFERRLSLLRGHHIERPR